MSNRNKRNKCSVCEKWMRSDHYDRHMKIHKDILTLSSEEMEEELKARHARKMVKKEREEKRQQILLCASNLNVSIPEEVQDRSDVEGEESIHQRLLKNKMLYLERVKIGEEISKYLVIDEIPEESLTKDDKDCLDLFRNQHVRLDISEVELRPWQKDAFKLFESATDRNIIWIYGARGNIGKSWFQNYVEAYFGYQRVFRSDLRIKHRDTCNILMKRGLTSIDIFLFNDSRSTKGEEMNIYRVLEDIKDGAATTSKYNNKVIKFKTPNTVMIFSNKQPNLKSLSKDRWEVYTPTLEGLKDCQEQLSKK